MDPDTRLAPREVPPPSPQAPRLRPAANEGLREEDANARYLSI